MDRKNGIDKNDRKNGIAVHAWDLDHRPDWDAAEVLETEPRYWKGCVLEAIWIQRISQTTNLDCGLTLNEAWTTHTH